MHRGMRGKPRAVLKAAAAVLAGAALFAGGHLCASARAQLACGTDVCVTLTLYDADGNPACHVERSVCGQAQTDTWQDQGTLPGDGAVSYSVTVRQETETGDKTE